MLYGTVLNMTFMKSPTLNQHFVYTVLDWYVSPFYILMCFCTPFEIGQSLTLYHTILSFNDPNEEALEITVFLQWFLLYQREK